ncbi:MAG: hypothetical protein U1U88_001657 [Lawsonella clevelandensis]
MRRNAPPTSPPHRSPRDSPSREVGVDADAAGTAAAAGGLGGRSAVPPVAATPEDTRPRISFVKPVASPAETGPLPIVNPTQPYYPERDEQEPAAQTTPLPGRHHPAAARICLHRLPRCPRRRTLHHADWPVPHH